MRKDVFDLFTFVPQLLLVGDDVPHMHIYRGEDVHLFEMRLFLHGAGTCHRSQLRFVDHDDVPHMHRHRNPDPYLFDMQGHGHADDRGYRAFVFSDR